LFLIEGNHDSKILRSREFRNQFNGIYPIYELEVQDSDAYRSKQKITLLHYAMRVWNKSHRGAWHLYGHSHGTLPDDPNSLSFDVGVDANQYFPISYQQVKARMKQKTWTPIDKHSGD
jgi:calcineurin-like phosphoesterase family protein